ncbi:beta-N-acetylhexosaminidase [Luteimonas notoginsengisoli]|uniref:beta-N-acetylhexosaminidase n=1 Tax=Luteimonas notoginsengisoli TaxID=1578200 RepID=A0ABV7UUX7_9GAMM
MKLRHILLLLALLPVTAIAATPADTAGAKAPLSLIPAPASLVRGEGAFSLLADTPLVAADPRAARVARQFAGLMQRSRGIALQVGDAATGEAPAIEFRMTPMTPDASPEAYSLDVSPQRVVVAAGDARGLFYGAVTLWQLATTEVNDGAATRIPALRIDDAPRFAWRGLMLDSARHFQSVDEIKQLLDAMARHKLNTFHWHLTDDQGWRLQIRKYPELTAIGGCRIPAGDGGIDPRTGRPVPYCGFYTQDEVRDIVRYAGERHITVVPEIDIPGHAQAAVATYPRLGSVDGPSPVSSEWGVHKYLFNADEDTFAFLEDVLAEVAELFPGRYVHIGGDEAVKDQWKASPKVQARMRALGVADEAQLQGYFVERMARFLAARGKRVIGWDEILEDDLPADAAVMSWRGIEGGTEAARKGHDVVMAPVSHLYLDYLQTDSPDEPPGRPTLIPLRKAYDFEPVPAALTAAQARHILGLQANVWTEHMRTFERVEHAFFPRIAAVAETGWSPRARKDYDDFLARLPAQLRRYRAFGIDYAQTPFAVRIEGAREPSRATLRVAMSTPLQLGEIRYTTDGSAPTTDSPRYRQPLSLPLPAQVAAAAFVDGRALAEPTSRRFDAASLLQREDEALAMCSQGLMLRLEDDGPPEGPRAIYNIDIFNPCWLWRDAPLGGIAAVEVRAGRIPYYFQLAGDEPNRKFRPARSAHGELELRNGCEGDLLASVPLPAAPGDDGFITLRAPLSAGQRASANLCIVFTGDTRPAMWAVDRVTLRRGAP